MTDDKSFFEKLGEVNEAVDEANATVEEPQAITCSGGIRLHLGAGNMEEENEG